MRLVEEYGAPPQVDLSSRNLEGADLNNLTLSRIKLTGARLVKANLISSRLEGANLNGADLSHAILNKADLRDALIGNADLSDSFLADANLERAFLRGSDLRRADLLRANLSGATLASAKLEGADLSGSELDGPISLVGINWGNSKVAAEIQHKYEWAQDIYRILRQLHQRAGLEEQAARFQYREMECQRKQAWQEKNWGNVIKYTFLWQFGGYGEKPLLIPLWSLAFVFFLAFLSWVVSLFSQSTTVVSSTPFLQQNGLGFGDFLYFHLASFTALGYGGWVLRPPDPEDLMKFVGAFESFIGAFSIGLFIAYVARIFTR